MTAADLAGLWEFSGYVTARGIVRPPLGSGAAQLRELLFFDANGRFFFAKFPIEALLAWDPDSSRFVSAEGAVIASGTWTLDGNRLVESLDAHGSAPARPNLLTLDQLTPQRLVIVEPTETGGETLKVAYDRGDVETFPAPPLSDATVAGDPARGADPVDWINGQQQLIAMLIESGRLNSAHRLSQRTVRAATTLFGARHEHTAACLVTLGACLSKVHESAAAVDVLEQAHRIYVDRLGPDHVQTASALNNLAPVYREESRWREALAAARRAIAIRSRALGLQTATATSVQNLGQALSGLGLLDEAAGCYFAAAAILEASFGAGHPRALRVRRNVDVIAEAFTRDRRFPPRTFASPRNLGEAMATLDKILAVCDAMLADEADPQLFALKFGRVAHTESYVNRIFDIRRLQQRIADQPADGSAARLVDVLRGAQTRLLDAIGVPRVRLEATLKRVDAATLGPKASVTLSCAFPNFEGSISRREERDQALRTFGIDPRDKTTYTDQKREFAEQHGYGVKLVEQQFRRYSGDRNLPRGRYFTVCEDATGNDRQTLCRELFEYADQRIPGLIFVSDSHDDELIAALESMGLRRLDPTRHFLIVMLLAPPDDAGREAFRHFLGPVLTTLYGPYEAAREQWDGLSLVVVPTISTTVAIDGVVDLRQRATQAWLYRFFRDGDGAVSVRSPSSRTIADFTGMLPSLMYPEYGGSGFTKTVGSWMRVAGVQGLVFPSARSNVSVTMPDEAAIAGFHGWNFVDYRDVDALPDRQFHVEDNPWYGFVAIAGVTPTLTATKTSWRVDGIDTRWREMRRLMLQLLLRN